MEDSRTRFARLSYTSSDSVPGAGAGWGVKESDGALTGPEAGELITRTPQLVAWDREVPQTAGSAEKARLPRRLSQHSVPGLGSCLFHTTPAGTDDSGRPGNTYTQAVLDRRPSAVGDPFRPTDAWRSPDWAVPFSKFEVAAARLGPWRRPAPGPLASADAVIGFVLDPVHPLRVFVLPCVLDAVMGALTGGPAVALGVDDPDEGASWIATVLRLLSPAHARMVPFSTFERAATVTAAVEAGLRIVCVPRADLSATDGSVAAIDTHAEQQHDPDRTAYVLADGTRVPVTDFSRVVTAVMDDETAASRVFALLDGWSARMAGRTSPVDFPVAAAFLDHVAGLADGGDEFAEARIAAARIVAGGGPDVDAALALRAVRLLVADPVLLRAAPRRSLPAVGGPELLGSSDARAGLDALLAGVGRGDEGASADLLCLLDLMTCVGAVPPPETHVPGTAPGVDLLLGGVERVVDGQLLVPGAAEAVTAAVGRVGRGGRRHVVAVLERRADAARDGGVPAGERIPVATLAWLFPDPREKGDSRVDEAWREYRRGSALTMEVAARLIAAAPGGMPRRGLAVDLVEAPWFPLSADEAIRRVVDLDDAEIRVVESVLGPRSAAEEGDTDPASGARSPSDPVRASVLGGRETVPRPPGAGPVGGVRSPGAGTDALLELAGLVPAAVWAGGGVGPGTRLAVQVAWLTAVVSGEGRVPVPPAVVRVPEGDPAVVVDPVRRAVGAEALAAAAFLAQGGAEGAAPVPEPVAALREATVGGVPVLAWSVRHAVPGGLDARGVRAHVARLLGRSVDPALGALLDRWLVETRTPIAPRRGDHP